MVSSNLDLIINTQDPQLMGRLSLAGSRVVAGPSQLRRLIRNDGGNASVRLCVPSHTGERGFNDFPIGAGTVSMGLGPADTSPTAGTWRLAKVSGSSYQTSALSFDASAAAVATAINELTDRKSVV